MSHYIYAYLSVNCYYFDEISNTPQKLCNDFFIGAQDLVLVQLTLIMQKINKKNTHGPFLGNLTNWNVLLGIK